MKKEVLELLEACIGRVLPAQNCLVGFAVDRGDSVDLLIELPDGSFLPLKQCDYDEGC